MKKIVIVIAILAVLIIGSAALREKHEIYEPQETYEDGGESTNVSNVARKETENNTEETENNAEKSIGAGLDSLDGPIKYDFNSEIESKLDAEKFDNAFREFLVDEKILETSNGGNGITMFTAKDKGWIKTYFDGGFSFDIQLQTSEREIISCSSSDGGYAFEIQHN